MRGAAGETRNYRGLFALFGCLAFRGDLPEARKKRADRQALESSARFHSCRGDLPSLHGGVEVGVGFRWLGGLSF